MINISQVELRPEAWEMIFREIDRCWMTETGGVLVGKKVGKVVSVSFASGPGPNCIRTPVSVQIDGAYTTNFTNRIFNKTNGRLDYVGDWHTHIFGSLSPSNDDVFAMRIMAESLSEIAPNPISIIIRTFGRRVKGYVYDTSHLHPIKVKLGPSTGSNL